MHSFFMNATCIHEEPYTEFYGKRHGTETNGRKETYLHEETFSFEKLEQRQTVEKRLTFMKRLILETRLTLEESKETHIHDLHS